MTTKLYCNLKQLFSCFLNWTTASPTIIRWLCSRLQIALFTVWTLVKPLTIDCNARKKIHFYNYVLVPVCRYLSSKELKTNSVKQMCIHYAQVQHYYRKIPGFMLRGLYKPDTSLRRTAEAGPDGVRLRESWLYPQSRSMSFLPKRRVAGMTWLK